MRKVLIFPGIGSTASMYHRLANTNQNIQICDWPEWQGASGLSELAKRCIEHYQIDEHTIVGGSSLGGMVSSEIAKHAKCRGLILIGSCLDFSCIPIRYLTSTGAWLIKDRWLKSFASKLPQSIAGRSSLLTDPAFVRWALQSMFEWSGVLRNDLNSIKSIHGLMDATIPYSKVNADQVILTGGHFIAITHYKTVSAFIDNSVHSFTTYPKA